MTVEELLNNAGFNYIDKGKDYLISCLNPEHEDANPSMRIDKLQGIYHCFSCGFKGNLFSDFGHKPNIEDIQIERIKNKIHNIIEENKDLSLPENSLPFKFDYRGISSSTLQKFEAFTNSGSDYEDRIIFPLRNIRNKITSFVGRYINSNADPKYKLYPKHAKINLYPYHCDIFQESIILVEGIFDMLNLHDKGLTNAVSCFGTTTLLRDIDVKLSVFKIKGVKKIYIMFDADAAGMKAAEKINRLLPKHGFISEIIELQEGIDPGDLSWNDVEMIKRELYG